MKLVLPFILAVFCYGKATQNHNVQSEFAFNFLVDMVRTPSSILMNMFPINENVNWFLVYLETKFSNDLERINIITYHFKNNLNLWYYMITTMY